MEPTIELPTKHGNFKLFHFNKNGQEGAVIFKNIDCKTPFVRIHSSCLFSETFGATDCDCSSQLNSAFRYIEEHGGIVIYLYQEGRGVGLKDKVKSISLEQKLGIHTVEAFEHLGHAKDPRNYDAAVEVLKGMGITQVKLGTANPRKENALVNSGIEIVERVHLDIISNELIDNYLATKVKHLDHYVKS